MSDTYVKRLRMEFDLRGAVLKPATLPEDYSWDRWRQQLMQRHADVKFACFAGQLDAEVFPALASRSGCRRLMYDIASRPGFVRHATWLIRWNANDFTGPIDVGTIQGIAWNRSLGSIQNVGVLAEHRGLGLGKALLINALHGFQQARLKRVYLEVTAENNDAVRLYRAFGFRHTRTSYRLVETITEPEHNAAYENAPVGRG